MINESMRSLMIMINDTFLSVIYAEVSGCQASLFPLARLLPVHSYCFRYFFAKQILYISHAKEMRMRLLRFNERKCKTILEHLCRLLSGTGPSY